MTNKQIEFTLSLKDNLTAQWKKAVSGVQGGMSGLVSTFKANWLAISASALAAFAVIQKGMEFSEGYANFAQSMNAFKSMAASVGMDATAEFQKLREASRGLIDDKSLVESANRALSLGIPLEKLAGFIQVASAKARDMGTDTTAAFNDLVVALGRGSAPILDNLGIIVKTEAANKAYADSVGKTVAQLTDAEKKQAFMNAALEAGQKALERQDLAMLSYNERIQQMRATAKNVELFIGQIITRIGVFIVGVFNKIGQFAADFWVSFLSSASAVEKFAQKMGLPIYGISAAYEEAKKSAASYRDGSMQAYQMATASASEFAAVVGGGTKAVGALGQVVGQAGAAAETFASGSLGAVKAKISELRTALDGMILGSNQYKTTLAEIKRLEGIVSPDAGRAAQKKHPQIEAIRNQAKKFVIEYEQTITTSVQQSAKLVGLTANDMMVSFGEVYSAIWEINGGFQSAVLSGLDTVHAGIVDGIGSAWESMFGEANSLLEMFIQSFITQLTSNAVKSAIGGLLSLIPGGGFLGGIFGGLFHGGGTVMKAHSGAYIDAPPSREIPILVRGGETIRTEAQEREIQRAAGSRGGMTINVYASGPIADAQGFKQIIEKGMRETGITDAARYFRSTRNNLVLEA